MRRLFWTALGATAGVLIVRRLSRTAQRWTPEGVAGSLTGAFDGLTAAVRDFAADVREGMAEREHELREGLGLDGRHDVVDAPSGVHPDPPPDVVDAPYPVDRERP